MEEFSRSLHAYIYITFILEMPSSRHRLVNGISFFFLEGRRLLDPRFFPIHDWRDMVVLITGITRNLVILDNRISFSKNKNCNLIK